MEKSYVQAVFKWGTSSKNRMVVRQAVLLVMAMKSASLNMKKTAQTVYAERATLANHAVSVLI